jgi:hypothetical protein
MSRAAVMATPGFIEAERKVPDKISPPNLRSSFRASGKRQIFRGSRCREAPPRLSPGNDLLHGCNSVLADGLRFSSRSRITLMSAAFPIETLRL